MLSAHAGLGHVILLGGLLVAAATARPATAQTSAPTSAAAPDGTTPLHQAVRQNDLKTVDALIKGGADVKAATRYGVTPIGLAALGGNTPIVRRLLDAGADP
ncbi:MAG TPA: ankyrin repeat domain-containing protein, partial [Vicinamibacterales bacterium]|nr:ankyrin repeat domain-containing protein [Vicinamibacterales bacterium]